MVDKKVIKHPVPAAAGPKQPEDAASQLKAGLMQDAFDRMFGKADGEPQPAPGKPHAILALATHARSGWTAPRSSSAGCSRRRGMAGRKRRLLVWRPP